MVSDDARSCSFDGVRFRRSRNGSLENFRSRRRGRGALCSPTSSRVTRCERGASLSRSPGAVLAGSLVSDDARSCSFDGIRFRRCGNCFLEIFLSRRRGRRALRSPTPPRVTGCERGATLSRSPGAGLAGSLVSDDAGAVLLTAFVSDETGTALLKISFPTMQGVSF